jgi:3-deoxy-manno-octulosonate cytidylyltransferase (CMP-KDO synthetase)
LTLVIIPARMNSTRLPGKPLLKIGDRTIIERCVEQAKKAGFVPIVATDSHEIQEVARKICPAIITREDCPSGTDRVAEAAEHMDPEGKHEFVINYQGDMPFLDPEWLKKFVSATEDDSEFSLTTAFSKVQLVNTSFQRITIESHIGLYGFTRQALREFAATPQTEVEKDRSLEQLRVPVWGFVAFPSMPIEINTQADLDRARSCLS